MARTALKVKTARKQEEVAKRIAAGKAPHFPTRAYHRCKLCGRVGGYMRKFEVCRICFRELASNGRIMGVTKSSW